MSIFPMNGKILLFSQYILTESEKFLRSLEIIPTRISAVYTHDSNATRLWFKRGSRARFELVTPPQIRLNRGRITCVNGAIIL